MRCFYVLQKAAKAGEGGDTVMTQTFMKEKNILPLVLSMSLPMVISMAVNSLYNIVSHRYQQPEITAKCLPVYLKPLPC